MAKFNGTNLIVKNGNIAIGHSTSCTLNINLDLPDATTKDSSGWNEHILGARDWSIDVEGLMDYSASSGVDELADLILNRVSASVEFGTGTTGHTKYTGTVSLSGLTMEGPLEGLATFSGTLVGTGAITKATY